ncbi:uncharacterized protein LOC117591352 [Drosophila guanche]|uniref:uncharacterized protein LOC117591352 n=1 Tax=Drosophila guanche TaxID=7266 RepID=UPI0014715160|nr:uncharacterized protein LOC117591352 [Drosophila guanche]
MEQWPANVALAQRPWIATGNSVAGLKSPNFYVRTGIHAYLMSYYSRDDRTVVMLKSEEKRLMVAYCYMAHDRPAPPEDLRNLQLRWQKLAPTISNFSLIWTLVPTTVCGKDSTSITEKIQSFPAKP